MTETEVKLADLINFSSKQKPLEFEASFKDILQSKVASAIENKKMEIATSMFSPPDVESDEDDQDLEIDSEEETEEQEDGEAA
ncbi:hypothetical protein UFOVP395_47 [uncultured Caudovirales phage]|jgi:hypothetical protein|uniref:Uncharacterized protein n=1 Tax=uncultured Caudovirales phage TaxID=2100421 RepID=A0A6J5M6F3_9CAUD|nr:hypothetical protein UFOVP395_47 [uncultured Caudovirales phage]